MKTPVWKFPSVSDSEWIHHLTELNKCMGSDTSYANLFFLRNKYNIEISFYKDCLLRHYHGTGSRLGYGFPIGGNDMAEIVGVLRQDARQREEPFAFCLVTEEQKAVLEHWFPGRFTYTENRNDADYIYLQSDLAFLKGKKYHKKKNHVSRFQRKYNDHCFRVINEYNKDDAWRVAVAWHRNHKGHSSTAQNLELEAIREALYYFEDLQLKGGILYVFCEPVAMTIASPISPHICDIHFEKALESYAVNGAYAVINQKCASLLTEYTYLNREEDIGLPGLRDAKSSYHPAILLKKYYAQWND